LFVPHLQVSQAGEVVYAFDRDFVGKIRQRSWLQRLRPLWKRTVNVGSYLARVAFGTALVVSALLVWLAVIAITSSRDDNRCVGVCAVMCCSAVSALPPYLLLVALAVPAASSQAEEETFL
jgi:hypothetical protein